jgi:hypothetical protein
MLWMSGETQVSIRDNPPLAAPWSLHPVDSVDNMVGKRDHAERPEWHVIHNPQPLLLRQLRIPTLVGTTNMPTRRPR